MKLAQDISIQLVERDIDRSELYIAVEAFICGSSARLTPILSIDKRLVGNGRLGPLTKKLAEMYESAQRGTTSKHSHWRLTV